MCLAGISPDGLMAGSDIVTVWVDSFTGNGYLQDRYADVNISVFPVIDSEQNVELIWSKETGGSTAFRFKRKIHVCDTTQDNDINYDGKTNHVIFVCEIQTSKMR